MQTILHDKNTWTMKMKYINPESQSQSLQSASQNLVTIHSVNMLNHRRTDCRMWRTQ